MTLKEAHNEAFTKALTQSNGNRTEAAKILGVSRYVVQRWCRKHGHQRRDAFSACQENSNPA